MRLTFSSFRLIASAGILAGILEYFKLTSAALLSAIAIAIGIAIPEYFDINPRDISRSLLDANRWNVC